jgi:hypothetical protein
MKVESVVLEPEGEMDVAKFCTSLGFAVMIEKSYLSVEDTCILTHTLKAI